METFNPELTLKETLHETGQTLSKAKCHSGKGVTITVSPDAAVSSKKLVLRLIFRHVRKSASMEDGRSNSLDERHASKEKNGMRPEVKIHVFNRSRSEDLMAGNNRIRVTVLPDAAGKVQVNVRRERLALDASSDLVKELDDGKKEKNGMPITVRIRVFKCSSSGDLLPMKIVVRLDRSN